MRRLPSFAAFPVAVLVALAACSDASAPPHAAVREHPTTDGGATDAAIPDPTGDGDAGDPPVTPDPGVPAADGGAPAGDGGAPAAKGPLFAYASGYASAIALFAVDPATGALTSKGSTPTAAPNPSFLAIDPHAPALYAVSETDPGRVAAYAIDRATGALTAKNDVPSGGNGPAHVAVDASGKWVLVANYNDGVVSVLPVGADGRLGAASDTQSIGANAHMVVFDPSGAYVFVPCKGADYVAQLRFDAKAGKLTPNAVPHLTTAKGAGPRHLAFHPNGKLAFLIDELDSTMSSLAFDAATGRLSILQTVSTRAAGATGTNTGAEVWVHPSGTLVFGSNRGDDDIVTFAVDAQTGALTPRSHTKSGGATPRDFSLDPTGAFLYVANQGTGNVVPFAVDVAKGALTPAGTPVSLTSPSYVGLVRFPAN